MLGEKLKENIIFGDRAGSELLAEGAKPAAAARDSGAMTSIESKQLRTVRSLRDSHTPQTTVYSTLHNTLSRCRQWQRTLPRQLAGPHRDYQTRTSEMKY